MCEQELINVLKSVANSSNLQRIQIVNSLYNTLDEMGRIGASLSKKVLSAQTLKEPDRTTQLIEIACQLIEEKQFANASRIVHMLKQ